MLHQSLVDGCALPWQAMLRGRAAATEEQCKEMQPSNPIYRCRQCGALFGGLQWTGVSNLQTTATVSICSNYTPVVGVNEAELYHSFLYKNK